MRHGKKDNHLGRNKSHRDALLSNMANSLLINKRITTTVAKAKALRKYVEPLITKAKTDSQHSRRTVFSYLQNKEGIKALFGEVAGRTAERAGGYTRIIKLGDTRLGDNAEMCLMELVDFNEIYKKDDSAKKGKTRRSRKGGKKVESAAEAPAAEPQAAAEEKPEKAKTSSKNKE
ncbi:MAG: 50S ribosomal protein L17 [Cyclobacteriaceae bacterium]|jgi:large subunit ribosomal protein L17|nr:50S ribosomal protein L17 [Flammeovirgaceae bacterium]